MVDDRTDDIKFDKFYARKIDENNEGVFTKIVKNGQKVEVQLA